MPDLPALDALRQELADIIRGSRLAVLFQPIATLADGEVFGYEGLVRGPSAHFLHSPINLFRAAEQVGLLDELDFACRRAVITAFAAARLPGKLFLNITPSSLDHPSYGPDATLQLLGDAGLAPQRVVIELTETQPAEDGDALKAALNHCSEAGFRIAIDDLGEGFASLKLWAELKPDYVKIDKYFIQGLADDAQKRQFVRSIQHIALNTGTRVIAEGVEMPEELLALRQIGITLAQGYLIARPQAQPARHLQLQPAKPGVSSSNDGTAGSLLVEADSVPPGESCEQIYQRFASEARLYALPVVDDGRPVGLLKRHEVLEFFARPFSKELYRHRPCTVLMDDAPLVVEATLSLQELSQRVTAAERRYLADGFIITRYGRYQGVGTGHDLMRAITELQIRAARYANPLTQLPGNVPIQERIEALLDGGDAFTIGYFDLDHFKPYNDIYGYARGDDMIRLVGELLTRFADARFDFVGHIGGDDFVVLFRSPDSEARCLALLAEFDMRAQALFDPVHLERGGYLATDRRGLVQQHPLVSLSVGLLHGGAGEYNSHHEVAAAATRAKHMAKRTAGSSCFVERRGSIRAPSPVGQASAA